ncbi:hypothetical protein GGX14DRAFT_426283 [Mycena pura]|uniref:Uncharacterized protein n=1 Tax=Mycena pura TaxID=153505 RepID=A0AAD7E2F1_9AGAR|nr:hypothetical protein GGX14DRAFT_426283 [Mycena pura]
MDPLEFKVSALAATEDWNAFKTDMKGFIPPQELADCHDIDIESKLSYFTRADVMLDNPAPFFAASVSKKFPMTRLTICGETFAVPLSSRDVAFLTGDASRRTVSAPEVIILTQGAKESILRTIKTVFGGLKVTDRRDGGQTLALAGLDVFKGGSHELSAVAKNTNHYATIFVTLPTFTESTDIYAFATHDDITKDVRLPEDLSQRVCAVGMLTGVSDARIEVGAGSEVVCLTYHASGVRTRVEPSVFPTLENLSGALPPLRDAFCVWRYRLSSGANTPALVLFLLQGFLKSPWNFYGHAHDATPARDFYGHDATLLCHLAPLAKAYGFKIYVALLTYTQSTTQEVDHPYKEYLGLNTDFDPSVLEMSDEPDEEHEWEGLYTLAGVPIAQPEAGLWDLATQLVTTDGNLQEQLRDVEPEEDYDIKDDSVMSSVPAIHSPDASAQPSAVRRASFLFVAP